MVPPLDTIRLQLGAYQPRLVEGSDLRFASVAIVLSGTAREPSVLLIERAQRPGDPWSGHMAFPGGRAEAVDRDLQETAERETLEEVGVDLTTARMLGRLDDQQGRRAGTESGITIASYVFHLPEPAELRPNEEVREAFWIPFSWLIDPARRTEHPWRDFGSFPGILVGEPGRHVVWGLTHRILDNLTTTMGLELP